MDMENTSISKLLLKMSPPVMLSLLIQSIYNIVDSFFVAAYSGTGLTALSLIYPLQLLMIALATGTGAGVNILISRLDGLGEKKSQSSIMKTGIVLAFLYFILFALSGILFSGFYFQIFSDNTTVQMKGVLYTRIVFASSLGLFVESICSHWDFLSKKQYHGDWLLCPESHFHQLHSFRDYHCYHFLLAGNRPHEGKYCCHCYASGCSAGSSGMGTALLGIKRSMVDISTYRNPYQLSGDTLIWKFHHTTRSEAFIPAYNVKISLF